MAPTVTLAFDPSGRTRAVRLPRCQPRSLASTCDTAIWSRVSPLTDPVTGCRSSTAPMVAGTTAVTSAGRPPTTAWPLTRPLTARTPGSFDTDLASTGEIPPPLPPPPKPPAEIAMSPVKEPLTPLMSAARSEAAYTVKRVTTATPIASAVAAAALRRGLRCALRLASVPVTPRHAASGRPSAPVTGRTATGPSTTKPPAAWPKLVANINRR